MSDRAIDTLLDEERRFPPDPAFAARANAQPGAYDLDPDAFWQREPQEVATLGACDPRSSRKVSFDKSQACSLLAAERMPQDAQVTIETLVLEVLL